MNTEDNVRLTQTGKGTPMGELLRRYWHPIAAATEFDDKTTKQVRLLGEDLVLYKDRSGAYGMLGLHCPHRRADLSYGFVEECGLRCSYHGWAFEEGGNCISAPFDDTISGTTRFHEQIKQVAYPVKELAGLLFAYLGPLPAPEVPVWETFEWENGFAQIVLADLPCNWLQSQENSIDRVHFEWLHNNWSARLAGENDVYAPTHMKIGFEEWEHGFGYRRILENTDESNDGWAFPRMCIMPNLFCPGSGYFEYKVPVDDAHTLHIVWNWDPVPVEQRPYRQDRIPHWVAPITDPLRRRWITSHVVNQDTVAWVGQGALTDRENEHLGRSDIGVVMLRNRLGRDLAAIAEGRDPEGVIRNPEAALIRWPFAPWRERSLRDFTREDFLDQHARFSRRAPQEGYFGFYAGQPKEVQKVFSEAFGL